MASKQVFHLGNVKISREKNALGKVFFRIPRVAAISRMTASDYEGMGDRMMERKLALEAVFNYTKAIGMLEAAAPGDSKGSLIGRLAELHGKRGRAYRALAKRCEDAATRHEVFARFAPYAPDIDIESAGTHALRKATTRLAYPHSKLWGITARRNQPTLIGLLFFLAS